MPATLDAVAQFAAEVVRFRDWARDGTDSGELAVRNALIRIGALYLAALELPPEWSDKLADAPDAQGIPDEERWAIDRSIAARLPFSDFARVFDPFVFPPEEPVAGPISNDIADIYREVVGGLIEYEASRTPQAVWEWGFGLRSHWGRHAMDAMHALHVWLAENACDQFHPQT